MMTRWQDDPTLEEVIPSERKIKIKKSAARFSERI